MLLRLKHRILPLAGYEMLNYLRGGAGLAAVVLCCAAGIIIGSADGATASLVAYRIARFGALGLGFVGLPLLAGGARLEEIVQDSDFQLGALDLDAATTGPLADDPAFRKAAMEADRDVETDLIELGDGGLVALRVDAVEPAAVIPLAEIRDRLSTFDIRRSSVPALAETVSVAVTFSPDAEPGERELRLQTELGLTNPLRFCVGQHPEYVEESGRSVAEEESRRRGGRNPVRKTGRARRQWSCRRSPGGSSSGILLSLIHISEPTRPY